MRGIVIRVAVLSIAFGAAALFVIDWESFRAGRAAQWTNDATLRGEVTQLSARVEGYVARTAADDFAAVRAGDVVVTIEDDDYRAELDRAEADLASARRAALTLEARLAAQRERVTAARAGVRAADADFERAGLEKARQDLLLTTASGLRRAWEQATAAAAGLEQQAQARRSDLVAASAGIEVLRAQLGAARATARAQEAARDLARIRLGWTRITAPEDGVITERRVRRGQLLDAGTPVAAFVPGRVWVVANYKEAQLRRVRPGQSVRVDVDAFPGRELRGRVDRIGPATEARSAALPPERDVGTFTRITQRVPVRVTLDVPPDLDGLLRPGMNVETTIDTVTVDTGGA